MTEINRIANFRLALLSLASNPYRLSPQPIAIDAIQNSSVLISHLRRRPVLGFAAFQRGRASLPIAILINSDTPLPSPAVP